MNLQEFNIQCNTLAAMRKRIIGAKRPEYTEGNVDVLNNFKTIAKELGLDPLQVWYTYFRKHVASVGQYCKNPDRETSEPIDGRFCDLMNYLELGYGLIRDKEARQGDGVPATPRRRDPEAEQMGYTYEQLEEVLRMENPAA